MTVSWRKSNWSVFLAYHSCGVVWIGAFLAYWWKFQREGRLSSFGDILGIFVLGVLLVALLAAVSIEIPLLWPKSRCEPTDPGRTFCCVLGIGTTTWLMGLCITIAIWTYVSSSESVGFFIAAISHISGLLLTMIVCSMPNTLKEPP